MHEVDQVDKVSQYLKDCGDPEDNPPTEEEEKSDPETTKDEVEEVTLDD